MDFLILMLLLGLGIFFIIGFGILAYESWKSLKEG